MFDIGKEDKLDYILCIWTHCYAMFKISFLCLATIPWSVNFSVFSETMHFVLVLKVLFQIRIL